MSRILREAAGPPGGTGGSGGATPSVEVPPGSATPPVQTPPPAPAQPASPSARGATSPDDDLSDLPESIGVAGREAIRREREARRDAEKRATDATAELEKRKRAEMSEGDQLRADNERLQGDVKRLTDEARERAIREAVADLAPSIGIGDPKLAARLLDSAKVEWGDDGRPKGKPLEKTLEELKREYPSIASRTRGSADAGAGASSEPNEGDINARIRERVRR